MAHGVERFAASRHRVAVAIRVHRVQATTEDVTLLFRFLRLTYTCVTLSFSFHHCGPMGGYLVVYCVYLFVIFVCFFVRLRNSQRRKKIGV